MERLLVRGGGDRESNHYNQPRDVPHQENAVEGDEEEDNLIEVRPLDDGNSPAPDPQKILIEISKFGFISIDSISSDDMIWFSLQNTQVYTIT